MASTLMLALVLVVLCTGGDTWELKSDLAPFSLSNTSNEYQYSHRLSCSHGQRVVVRYVQNGYKTRECHCETDQQCCQFSYKDCLRLMPPEIFQQVTMECWDKDQCRPLVTKPRDSCQEHGMEFLWPTYSQAWYYCVPANTVVDMTRETSASGYKVTARALPAGLPYGHSVTCSVQTAGYAHQRVLVYLDAVISQGPAPLSCLHLKQEMLCREGRAATDLVSYTPFTFRLQQPVGSSMHFAWVTVQEIDSVSRIRVSCEPEETTLPSTVRPSVTDADVAQTTSSRTLPTTATSRELPTSETRGGGSPTSDPVSSSPGGGDEREPGKEDANPPVTVTDADVAQTTSPRTLPTTATTRELPTSETRDGGTPTSDPVSSSPGGGDEWEPGKEDANPPVTVTDADVAQTTSPRTLPTTSTTRELPMSETRDRGTPTSDPVSSSPGGGDEREPGKEDANPPVTDSVAVVVAALVAGVVGALAAGLVVFLWRRRWRAKKWKQPNQGGHGVKAELPKDRRDVIYEPLLKTAGETGSHYERLALPGRVWTPDGDKEESPYDVIEPSHDYEQVN